MSLSTVASFFWRDEGQSTVGVAGSPVAGALVCWLPSYLEATEAPARGHAGGRLSYEVYGWVEFRVDEDAHYWPLLYIGAFVIWDDDVSSFLFGLSKAYRRHPAPRFAARGMPADASYVVKAWHERPEVKPLDPEEGPLGLTYASWEEIQEALRSEDAPDIEESPWLDVIRVVEGILTMPRSPFGWRVRAEDVRVVAWGVW